MLICYIKVTSTITHFYFETFEVFLHFCLPSSSLEFYSTKNTVWKHCLSFFPNVNIQVARDVAIRFHFYALLKSLSNSSWFMHTTAADPTVHLFLLTHRNSSCLHVICSPLCFATVALKWCYVLILHNQFWMKKKTMWALFSLRLALLSDLSIY